MVLGAGLDELLRHVPQLRPGELDLDSVGNRNLRMDMEMAYIICGLDSGVSKLGLPCRCTRGTFVCEFLVPCPCIFLND